MGRLQRVDVCPATSADKQHVLRLLDEIGEEINGTTGYSPHNVEAQAVGGAMYDVIMQRQDTMIFVAVVDDEVIQTEKMFRFDL